MGTVPSAHKAFATIRNQQLSTSNGTTCTLSLHPHDASPGSAPPSPPKDARPLNVSELPPHYTPGLVYDRFISYGPIFSCEMPLLRGSCRLTFCDPKHATRAQEEMNFSALETYQIIVRFPSKYDAKDSFKAAGLGLGAKSAHAQQQQHQQRRVVSESVPASAATRPGPGADAGDRRASAGGHHAKVNRTAIFASSINGIIQQARGPAAQQPSPESRTNATPDGTSHIEADASAVPSAAATMPSTPAPSKKAAGPVKISDPVRLIVQNLPSSLDAPGLYRLFAGYGSLAEASLASHRATGARLGIGLLRYSSPEEAAGALKAMNGRFVEGHRASQPLYIKLWELKGELESDLRTDEAKVHRAEPEAEAGPGGAAPSQPLPAASAATASPSSDAGELVDKAPADRREASFASTSSTSAATADTTLVSNVSSAPSSPAAGQLLPSSGKADSAEAEHAATEADPGANAIPPELRRHHKLLLLSLQDDLREPPERAEKLADLLVRLLPESERSKCILDEGYLRERVRKAGEAFGGPERGSEGHVGIEPERVVYDRAALLHVGLFARVPSRDLADIMQRISLHTPLRTATAGRTAVLAYRLQEPGVGRDGCGGICDPFCGVLQEPKRLAYCSQELDVCHVSRTRTHHCRDRRRGFLGVPAGTASVAQVEHGQSHSVRLTVARNARPLLRTRHHRPRRLRCAACAPLVSAR